MRQLGRHRLEDQPGRHDPGDQEQDLRLLASHPGEGHRHRREGRRRPVGREEDDEIKPGRPPMLFLPLGDLAEHVLADAVGEEAAAGLDHDRGEPGQRDHKAEQQSGAEAQRLQPAEGALARAEHENREAPDHRYDRPLDQQAERGRAPEHQPVAPVRHEGERARPVEPGSGKRAHRGDGAGRQKRIGLGDARLDPEQHRGSHQRPAKQGQRRRQEGQ